MEEGFSAARTGEYALPGACSRHRSNQLVLSADGTVLAAALVSEIVFFLLRDLHMPAARGPLRAHPMHVPVNYACLLCPFGRESFCFTTEDDHILFFELKQLMREEKPRCVTLNNLREVLPAEDFGGTWSLAHLPAEEWLLAGSNLRCVNVYQFAEQADGISLFFSHSITFKHNIPFISVSPCGQFFAVACISGQLSVYSPDKCTTTYEMDDPLWTVEWVAKRAAARRLRDYSLLVTTAVSVCQVSLRAGFHIEENIKLQSQWNSRIYLHECVPELGLFLYYVNATATLMLLRHKVRGALSFGEVSGVDAGAKAVGLRAFPAPEGLCLFLLYETGLCRSYRLEIN